MSFKLESGPLPLDATHQQIREAELDLFKQQKNIILKADKFDLIHHLKTTTATLQGAIATELNMDDLDFEDPETTRKKTVEDINMLRERILGLKKDLELIEEKKSRQEKDRVEAQRQRQAVESTQTQVEADDDSNADVHFFDVADSLNVAKFSCTLNAVTIAALKDAVINQLCFIPDIELNKYKNENPAIQLFLRLIANHALNRENPMAIIYKVDRKKVNVMLPPPPFA